MIRSVQVTAGFDGNGPRLWTLDEQGAIHLGQVRWKSVGESDLEVLEVIWTPIPGPSPIFPREDNQQRLEGARLAMDHVRVHGTTLDGEGVLSLVENRWPTLPQTVHCRCRTKPPCLVDDREAHERAVKAVDRKLADLESRRLTIRRCRLEGAIIALKASTVYHEDQVRKLAVELVDRYQSGPDSIDVGGL